MKQEKILLIDIESTVYQCIEDCKIEEVNDQDEYVHKVPSKLVWNQITNRIKDIQIETEVKDFIIFFGSKNNFRKKISSDYKKFRKPKPLGFESIKQKFIDNLHAKIEPWLEADDLIGLYATTPKMIEYRIPIIVSEDKDMKLIPGLHFNYRKPELGIVSISPQEAIISHLIQTMSGDQVDGYYGIKGVGPVKAKKILGTTPVWSKVISAFKEKGYTKEDALVNARLAYILQNPYYDFENKKIFHWTPVKKSGPY